MSAAVGRPPASRRSTSVSSGSAHSPSSSISKGATARAAASPRVPSNLSPAARRGSLKSPSPPALTGETRESLALALRHETDAKEQLLVQLQDKESIISSLTEENDHMSSALNAAESRLSELYTEQNRMEEEMSARIEVAEKLRQQVRELEKEKRDLTRRYNEQTSTFEAERQTFYDNETHLKSRITSLTQARRNQPPPTPTSPSLVDVTDTEDESDEEQQTLEVNSSSKEDEDSEPAEMTSLRMELSTLESSYASMQNTVSLLQHQLSDLKRVNRTLQEDNESYMILLREKTLSGQFNVMRMGNASEGSESSSDLDTDERDEDGDQSSMRSGSRSYLGTVSEHPDEGDQTLDPDFDNQLGEDGERLGDGEGSLAGSLQGGSRTRHGRRPAGGSTHSPKQRGESLANLPISGPGLDLAAELGRAENKDVLEDPIDPPPSARPKKGRKSTGDGRGGLEPSDSANDIHAMRSRVKMLEDANKALSLYASKIIDRIIAQEGFEHVLAVDYEANKSPATPAFAPPPASKEDKHRRRATMFAGSAGSQMPMSPQPERLTTFESIMSPKTALPPPTTAPANKRRSFSVDWRGFSLFGGDKKTDASPDLRLQTGGRNFSGPGTARKLDTEEDEEDRKERERLHATMKLMGIDKPMPPPMVKSHTAPDSTSITPATPTDPSSTVSSPPSRFSFFRRPVTSETSSIRSTPSTSEEPQVLTHDALVQSEAESALAALDVHERQLSVELAKGGSSGFTEIQRKSRRGRASGGGSGSGSTVWSAGMSTHGEHGDE